MTESPKEQKEDDHTEFRFFDNRQKYLLFVNTCSEKWVIGERITRELKNITPTPPSIRIFLSCPWEKKATQRLSGEKVGFIAPSVPGSSFTFELYRS